MVNVGLSTARQYNVTATAFVAYMLVHCSRMQLIRPSAIECTNYTFRYICRGTRPIRDYERRRGETRRIREEIDLQSLTTYINVRIVFFTLL